MSATLSDTEFQKLSDELQVAYSRFLAIPSNQRTAKDEQEMEALEDRWQLYANERKDRRLAKLRAIPQSELRKMINKQHNRLIFPETESATETNRHIFRDAKGGIHRCLFQNETVADAVVNQHADDFGGIGVGDVVSAYVTGDWSGVKDSGIRNLSTGLGSGGGFTVPSLLSARIIDKARNQSTVLQAGAQTLPMESKNLTIARVATDATATWTPELSAATESNPTFEAITLQAGKLVTLVTLSVELADDGVGIAEAVENAIAQAMALEWDRAALRGSGIADEPLGIRNQDDVTQTAIGGPITYDDLLDSLNPIEVANGIPTGWILHPTELKTIRKLKDGSANYLHSHPDIAPLNRMVSNQQTAGEITVGDFSQVILGVRTELKIELFRTGQTDVTNLLTQSAIALRATFRGAVHLTHPDHFNVLTGIT